MTMILRHRFSHHAGNTSHRIPSLLLEKAVRGDVGVRALQQTIEAIGEPVASRAIGAATNPRAAIARWRHGPTVVDIPPSNAIRLAISLFDSRNTKAGARDLRASRIHGASATMFGPMEGISVEVQSEADVVQLLIDHDSAQAMLGQAFFCPPVLHLHDDRTRSMVMQLFVRSATFGPDDALLEEGALESLIARLELHVNGWRRAEDRAAMLYRGGLAPSSFRRLEEMIESALDEAGSLTLGEMARSINLSVTHLVRSFHQHTGYTPHKYVVRRRIARAIAMLRRPANSIAEVGDHVGFSTPAHFVATFRTVVGVTPGALRGALNS
jgi:AraC family transcriptional regulator